MFAFWDKERDSDTLVIATHGIIKKQIKRQLVIWRKLTD
jgi:hypothetical protein